MEANVSRGNDDFDPDECHFVRNKFVDTDYEEIAKIISDLPIFCDKDDTVNLERFFERFVYLTNQYQEQRHLLDAKLNEFIDSLLNQVRDCWNDERKSLQIHETMKYLWHLSKVRGPKVFIRRLPHDVDDFEPVLNLLRSNENRPSSPKWEIRYVCLLWLSLLCKLPFSFDLLLTASESSATITPTLFETGRQILLKYGDKSREAACTFLCELISRSDFRYGTENSVESCLIDLKSEFLTLDDQILDDEQKILAFLTLFCHLFKRLDKKCWNYQFIESLLQNLLSKKFESSKDILIRKLNAKLTQRIALVIIQSSFKVDSDWLYKKQAVNLNQSLKSNQIAGDGIPSKNHSNGNSHPNLENLRIDDDHNERWSGDLVEKIVDYLTKALDDKDTIVRWSAAKGIGRITAKLPKNLANNVVNLILRILEQNEKDSAVHGACLALAELGRRGCLLPARLPRIMGAVSKALTYEQLRATYSIGGHVRDAACYVCWSLARAFKKCDLEPHIRQLIGRLIAAALFDAGVTCRRAASAALQEIVGRLPDVVSGGLDLIGVLDYASVGDRTKCYRRLSSEVSSLDADYARFIFEHVVNLKLSHFDQEIRNLASDCLGNLVRNKSKPEIIEILRLLEQNCYSKNSFLRNGSLLAIGKILPFVDQSNFDELNFVQSIPGKLSDQNLLTGIGADITKSGANFLISTLSQFTPENFLSIDFCKRWFEILYSNMNENLGKNSPLLDQAATGLGHFCSKTKNFQSDFKLSILEKFSSKLENPVDEMDCSVGILGVKNSVPYFVACKEKTDEIVTRIKKIFDVFKPEYSTWVVARCRCIEALTAICVHLLDEQGSDESLISQIIESILTGFDDYTSTSKGDTGFFVRQTSVQAVSKFLLTVEKSSIDDQLREKFACKLLKSLFDRNDILRKNSFDVLKSIQFEHSLKFDHLSSEFYENLTDLLDDPKFGWSIFEGLIWMIGSTTESVSKIAVDALLSYLNEIRENKIALQFFVQNLLNFCQKVENGRGLNESISFFKTLDVVFSSNFLENYSDEKDLGEIFEFLQKQTCKTKNRQKLISGSQILCSMLQFNVETPNFTRKCSKFLLENFLLHNFPFVRKKTAENLYEALLNYGQLDNHNEWVLTMLTDTDWSRDGKKDELKESVEKLKDALL